MYILIFTTDYEDLCRSFQQHSPLQLGYYTFIADAVTMYVNIDQDHAAKTLLQWLINIEYNDLPPELLVEAIKIIMSNNYFQFGDTYWKQISGVAMGTPTACMLATVYYGIYENTVLIPKYKANIQNLKQFIDDMLAIFIIKTAENIERWEEFKKDLPYGKLTWTVDPPSKVVNFLDLTIQVYHTGLITTKTFQKKMNLYLYIPPYSAHPSGLFKSIIYSTIRRYW